MLLKPTVFLVSVFSLLYKLSLSVTLPFWWINVFIWVGEAHKNRKKFEISKMKPTLAGSGGKRFRANGRRLEYVVGEPTVYRLIKTGPAHIVQFRRQGPGRGGLSKNSTLPHAQIWGPTPNFKILSCGYSESIHILEMWRKNLRLFSRYEF